MWWVPLATAALSWYGNRKSARDAAGAQVGQTQKEAMAGIIGRVEGAKAAGLHPLAALGSTVGGAVMPVGNSFNAIADGIGEAAMAYRDMKVRSEEREYNRARDAADDKRQAEMDALTRTQAAQQVEANALRNELTKAQIEAQRKAMSDSDRDFAASQAQLARMQGQTSVPLRRPIPPQYVPVRDRFGKIQHVPNPDFYDLELPESVGAATLAIPEAQNSTWLQDAWESVKSYFRKSKANPQGLPDPVEY